MANVKCNGIEKALIDTAKRVLPGGGFGNVSHDIIIAEGRAGRVWDVSGNEYVDYLLGSGPMIVGHAHPEVVEVVREQALKGTTFLANNPHDIQLAAQIVDAVPCAEKVRFVSSSSEADLYAMRLARAHTKRDKIASLMREHKNELAGIIVEPARGSFRQSPAFSKAYARSRRRTDCC